MRAEALDIAGLQEVKQAIASHIVEFAPRQDPALRVAWTGDGAGLAQPPNFRVLTVTDVTEITPHMRRIGFAGMDLARFDSLDALHVRLFLPQPNVTEPEWPTLGEDGLLRVPSGDKALAVRKYTIREIDAAAGTLSVDFVMHDDAGPGAAFAARARIGEKIGMAGPGGRGLRDADWYLFLGDETALPAIGRMLANLPATARGSAIIEVADATEEQHLLRPAGVEIRWLHRNGAEPGTATLLQDAFEAVAWPADHQRVYVWAALEHEGFKAIRACARALPNLDRDSQLVVSYWRRGLSEEQHVSQKVAQRQSEKAQPE